MAFCGYGVVLTPTSAGFSDTVSEAAHTPSIVVPSQRGGYQRRPTHKRLVGHLLTAPHDFVTPRHPFAASRPVKTLPLSPVSSKLSCLSVALTALSVVFANGVGLHFVCMSAYVEHSNPTSVKFSIRVSIVHFIPTFPLFTLWELDHGHCSDSHSWYATILTYSSL